ncbi:hypothetical protein HYFRA_00001803 [Hymenoscyphus fraxineus]|uniref:Ribosomal protein S16 n=1 Tax=Hymenoscyphus fraxineus TaxID=746836 RepID=A0A9N9PMH4_9HELO|nr:hypothetical protein HYFRA_00001803 [Hymenoscyphus fraxineus]
MVVKIRLARFGRRKAPFYNIVVAQARTARNSKPIEVLGTSHSLSFSPRPHCSSSKPRISGLMSYPRGIHTYKKKSSTYKKPGTYDPIPKAPIDGEGKPFKDIKLDSARAKYWLGVGAQPSDPAWRLLSMAGLLPPKYMPKPPSSPVAGEAQAQIQ